MVRRFFVWLHRWVGLAMAGFLVVVGLTGSLLAFDMELERIFAPQLFAKAPSGAAPLDLATLAERAQALVPRARLIYLAHTAPDQTKANFEPLEDPETRAPYDLDFTEFFVDPFTGAELGRRRNADLSQGAINLMPFVYELHWRLVLGDLGQWTLGIIAFAWTTDCFVGFYLTLPHTATAFWRRWKPAWLIKRGASFYRLNFDLHRAAGLWFWALLFVFAWSSVMMDMRRPIYEWVMGSLFDFTSRVDDYEKLPKRETTKPRLDWRAAQSAGESLLALEASKRGFTTGRPFSLQYVRAYNVYSYEARSSIDVVDASRYGGGVAVTFDGDNGALVSLTLPRGQRLGNTIENWLYALHMGLVFGMPYRILVCVLGFVISMLSITGVYIWWKKRRARKSAARAVSNPRLAQAEVSAR
ncbi:MAG TPA: PepSY-associated TM helix domain-containing protein [Methylocystis sp.]|jgi:uncharacterized iron-regulated membrane protein